MRLYEFIEPDMLGKPTLSAEEVAGKHGVPLEVITRQLAIGTQVEKEHTGDESIAMEIALDHLAEMPDYYSRLQDMENEA